MSKAIQEFRLFEVCIDAEKKDIMLKALENQLDLLEKIQASKIRVQEVKQLKEEIEKMNVCQ